MVGVVDYRGCRSSLCDEVRCASPFDKLRVPIVVPIVPIDRACVNVSNEHSLATEEGSDAV